MPNEPKKICFAIMPFSEDFDDISELIAKSAQKCGLEYVRGDHRNKPGPIMPQILNDIKQATVIVADVTEHNPNVFYELGIAHQIKGPEHVVLLIRSKDKFPFDVSALRHVIYTHSKAGLADLRKKLKDCLREALKSQVDREVWNIIRGPHRAGRRR